MFSSYYGFALKMCTLTVDKGRRFYFVYPLDSVNDRIALVYFHSRVKAQHSLLRE